MGAVLAGAAAFALTMGGICAAFGAWQTYNRCVCDGRFELAKKARENLVYECCDVIQATANLMARFANSDDEIYSTMRRMRENNMKRGRYGA